MNRRLWNRLYRADRLWHFVAGDQNEGCFRNHCKTTDSETLNFENAGTLDWDNNHVHKRHQMAKWKIKRRLPKDHRCQIWKVVDCNYLCMLVHIQYCASNHNAWTRVFTGTLSRMTHVSTQEPKSNMVQQRNLAHRSTFILWVPVRPLFLGKEQGKSWGSGKVGLAITRTREVALRRRHWCGSTAFGVVLVGGSRSQESGACKRLMMKG